jgi:hypothetical protein
MSPADPGGQLEYGGAIGITQITVGTVTAAGLSRDGA